MRSIRHETGFLRLKCGEGALRQEVWGVSRRLGDGSIDSSNASRSIHVAQPNRKATYRTCGPAAYVGVGDRSRTAEIAQKRLKEMVTDRSSEGSQCRLALTLPFGCM